MHAEEVPADEIDYHWEPLRVMLQDLARKRKLDISLDAIRHDLLSKHRMLIYAADANGKVLGYLIVHVEKDILWLDWFVTLMERKELSDLFSVLPDIERWFRDNIGTKSVYAEIRPGLLPLMRALGYRPTRITVTKGI